MNFTQRYLEDAKETKKLREAAAKANLIDFIIDDGRVCYRPVHKPWLVERHTTSVLLYGTESPARKKFLINNAIHFQGSIKDYQALHALASLNPHSKPGYVEIYEVLGLYLYLADQVSMHPNSKAKSVLKAFRDNGFELAAGETRFDLKKRFINSLIDLELYHLPHIQQLVEDWCKKGNFMVNGVLHEQNSNGSVTGAYNNLASYICNLDQSVFAQISKCISYALGNRETMLALQHSSCCELVAYAKTASFIDEPEYVEATIEVGDITRYDKMEEEIQKQFGENKPAPLHKEGRQFFKKALDCVPLPLLRIFTMENFLIAYTDQRNITNLYPEGDELGRIPGYTSTECDRSRINPGTRLSRFFTIMVCDGRDGVQLPPHEKLKKLQLTVHHELIHVALNSEIVLRDHELSNPTMNAPGYLHKPGSEIYNFKQWAASECQKIYLNRSNPELNEYLDKPCLLDNTKPEIPRRYLISAFAPATYDYPPEQWQEEMLANLSALRYEIPKTPAFQPLHDVIARLDKLIDKIAVKIESEQNWETSVAANSLLFPQVSGPAA